MRTRHVICIVCVACSGLSAAAQQRESKFIPLIAGPPRFSSDGRFVAVIANALGDRFADELTYSLQVLRTDRWEPVNLGHVPTEQSSDVTWSSTGHRLAAVFGGLVWCWNADTGEWSALTDRRHKAKYAVKWSPDGQAVMSWDGACFIKGEWPMTPEAVWRLGPVGEFAFDFSPDGKGIWVGIWDARSASSQPDAPNDQPAAGRFRNGVYFVPLNGDAPRFVKRLDPIDQIQVSPDGKRLACLLGERPESPSCFANPTGKVVILNIESGKTNEIAQAPIDEPLSWSRDGMKLSLSLSKKDMPPAIFLLRENRLEQLPQAHSLGVTRTSFHPATGTVWSTAGGTISEFINERWNPRFTLPPEDKRQLIHLPYAGN